MQAADEARVAGLVLAGGASSRMGRDKAFVELAGRPLIAHVLARFAPQVGPMALAAHDDAQRYAPFALPILADRSTARCGPLAGILAGLDFARNAGCEWIAVAPCDAPFLPRDLVARLIHCRRPGAIVAAASESGLEPLFSLWPVEAADALGAALARGEFGAAQSIRALPHALARFAPARPDPFFNVNSPADLERASHWLSSPRGDDADQNDRVPKQRS